MFVRRRRPPSAGDLHTNTDNMTVPRGGHRATPPPVLGPSDPGIPVSKEVPGRERRRGGGRGREEREGERGGAGGDGRGGGKEGGRERGGWPS